jgi:hypothetical protein
MRTLAGCATLHPDLSRTLDAIRDPAGDRAGATMYC